MLVPSLLFSYVTPRPVLPQASLSALYYSAISFTSSTYVGTLGILIFVPSILTIWWSFPGMGDLGFTPHSYIGVYVCTMYIILPVLQWSNCDVWFMI